MQCIYNDTHEYIYIYVLYSVYIRVSCIPRAITYLYIREAYNVEPNVTFRTRLITVTFHNDVLLLLYKTRIRGKTIKKLLSFRAAAYVIRTGYTNLLNVPWIRTRALKCTHSGVLHFQGCSAGEERTTSQFLRNPKTPQKL